jgi:hypothetical protein
MKKYIDFESWVNIMYNKACKQKEKNNIVIGYIRNAIIITRKNDFKMGIAKKHPDDKFDNKIGIAIAYARLNNITVPPMNKIIYMEKVAYNQKNAYIKINNNYYLMHKICFDNTLRQYICVVEFPQTEGIQYQVMAKGGLEQVLIKEE